MYMYMYMYIYMCMYVNLYVCVCLPGQVVPIDAHSELPPLHTDIAALSHKECDSQALSIWDVKEELS